MGYEAMKAREQFQTEIEKVKTLGNQIRIELGLEVAVDDVDALLGGETVFLLVLLLKAETAVAQKQLERALIGAGYKCRERQSKDGMIVWDNQEDGNLAFVFRSAREFRSRSNKATTLIEAFRDRPDYLRIAQMISRVHNSAVARDVFLRLSYDERFVNKTYGKDKRIRWPSKLAESLGEKYHVDVFIDDINTYITGGRATIYILIRDKEIINGLGGFLEGEGYKYYKFPADKECWAWQKAGAESVFAVTENVFKGHAAKYDRLMSLFTKRPDYTLIAEMYQQVMNRGEFGEIFEAVARDNAGAESIRTLYGDLW
jgi:ribosomal protein L21